MSRDDYMACADAYLQAASEKFRQANTSISEVSKASLMGESMLLTKMAQTYAMLAAACAGLARDANCGALVAARSSTVAQQARWRPPAAGDHD